MPLSRFPEVPYIEQQDLYEYLQDIHNIIFGTGPDSVGGSLDDDNLLGPIAYKDRDETITGAWTFTSLLTVLTTNAGLNLIGTLNLTGDANFVGNFNLTGDFSMVGDVSIDGDVTVTGRVRFDGIDLDYNKTIKWGEVETLTHDGTSFIFDDSLKIIGDLWATSNIGINTGVFPATYRLEIEDAGNINAIKDIVMLQTEANATPDMSQTGTGILFNLFYYDAVTPAAYNAGRFSCINSTSNLDSNPANRHTYFQFDICNGGAIAPFAYLDGSRLVFTDLAYDNVQYPTAGYIAISRDDTGETINTDYINLVNRANAAVGDGGMVDTRTSIRFAQCYYHATVPAPKESGSITVGTETNWLSDITDITSQDSYMAFSTTLDGVSTERLRIASSGLTAITGVGSAKANFNLLTLTNTVNVSDMDGTETSILFNQWYYDAVTPAIADAGRIAVGTLTDWIATGETQDAYMDFYIALDGTMMRNMRLTSFEDGAETQMRCGIGIIPASVLHIYENTAQVDADAGLTIEQDDTGDAVLQFLLTNGQRFVMGIDNSDGDKFKILDAVDLSSATAILTIDPATNKIGVNITAPNEDLEVAGTIRANTAFNINGSAGVSGSWTTVDGKTVTSTGGLITSIV